MSQHEMFQFSELRLLTRAARNRYAETTCPA